MSELGTRATTLTVSLGLPALGAERHAISEICGECYLEKFATCGGFLEGAGSGATNMAFKQKHLYITEASQGVIWRVAVTHGGLPFFHER